MGSHPGRILKNSSAGAGTGVGLGGIFAPKRVAPKLISTNVRCRGSLYGKAPHPKALYVGL